MIFEFMWLVPPYPKVLNVLGDEGGFQPRICLLLDGIDLAVLIDKMIIE